MATYEDYCKKRGIPFTPIAPEEPIVIFEDEPEPKKTPAKKKAAPKKKAPAKKKTSASKSKAKAKA
tara:strand:- start:147 stop:344 length:198 start_codon:yes stop_codon:yes gene_type:complete